MVMDKITTEIKKDILYRDTLLNKARNRERLSKEEHAWLVTHSSFNDRLGFPFYNESIEHLKPNIWYWVKIEVESLSYNGRIIPSIGVPNSKGQIVANFEVVDLQGNKSLGKSVKILGFELDLKHKEFEVKYLSELGLISVGYECDYFVKEFNHYVRQASSTGSSRFAMIREVINDHKVSYNCKSPVDDSFGAMVFTVEWIEEDSIT